MKTAFWKVILICLLDFMWFILLWFHSGSDDLLITLNSPIGPLHNQFQMVPALASAVRPEYFRVLLLSPGLSLSYIFSFCTVCRRHPDECNGSSVERSMKLAFRISAWRLHHWVDATMSSSKTRPKDSMCSRTCWTMSFEVPIRKFWRHRIFRDCRAN